MFGSRFVKVSRIFCGIEFSQSTCVHCKRIFTSTYSKIPNTKRLPVDRLSRKRTVSASHEQFLTGRRRSLIVNRFLSNSNGDKNEPPPNYPEDVKSMLDSEDVKKDPELSSLLNEIASDFPADLTMESGKISDSKINDTLEPVFTIDNIVELLEEENAQDICVIQVPKQKKYVDYFIVVTGKSPRHLKAMCIHINQAYKAKKTDKHPFCLLEGKYSDDWKCTDFGNIVVHYMLEDTREVYELEKLWTLGPEHDDQYQNIVEFQKQMEELVSLSEDGGEGLDQFDSLDSLSGSMDNNVKDN